MVLTWCCVPMTFVAPQSKSGIAGRLPVPQISCTVLPFRKKMPVPNTQREKMAEVAKVYYKSQSVGEIVKEKKIRAESAKVTATVPDKCLK